MTMYVTVLTVSLYFFSYRIENPSNREINFWGWVIRILGWGQILVGSAILLLVLPAIVSGHFTFWHCLGVGVSIALCSNLPKFNGLSQ